MVDYSTELVKALKQILPTYHELKLTQGLKTPCFSYQEANNYADTEGDTLGYSKISYQIKIWGTDIAIIQKYLLELDKTMRKLGFKRTSVGELSDRNSSMIQKITIYEALAYEEFE